jgi:phosphoglycolate phosphatase
VVRDAATRGPLAVLTNKPQAPTHRLLEAFDLARYFRRVIGGDSGAPRKPNPAGLQALMTEVGASPAETMLVGDSMIDVETARRAGARMCVALYGFGHARGEMVLDGTELTARTPTDVGEVVGRFFRPGV